VADAKSLAGADLEVVHFLVVGLARQVIDLVLVRRISTPVTARGEGLADNQAAGGQFGLGRQGQNLMEVSNLIKSYQ
jgi:hypothetical protein